MTNEEKVALYGCSIQGYLKYFKDNNYQNAKDAIDGSIKYILRRGVDEGLTDCNINELIYVVKNEIAKMVAKEQLKNNPNELTNMHSKDEKNVQYFLKDPFEYVGKELSKNGNKYEVSTNNIIDGEEKKLARKYNKNVNDLGRMLVIPGIKVVYNVYEGNQADVKSYNIINQLQSKLPHNSIEEAFDRQKPSFFEKLFRRTSSEYKNFKTAFNNFNDKNHPLNGSNQYLKDAAMGYIRHKFPNLEDDKLPTAEQIEALGGAGKERAAFCLKVVETLNEHGAIQEQADKVTEAIKNVEIKDQDNIIDNSFQKDLKNDLDDKIVDNNLVNENDNNEIIVNNEIGDINK